MKPYLVKELEISEDLEDNYRGPVGGSHSSLGQRPEEREPFKVGDVVHQKIRSAPRSKVWLFGAEGKLTKVGEFCHIVDSSGRTFKVQLSQVFKGPSK